MKFSPKVSIVIPVYNGSNYLQKAIGSALAQTYKNIEVIVVNDGSKDDGKTEGIAKSYGNKIRYFHKENGGVASALNVGIRMMEGEYFSWLSHDDVYYPHKIEKQMEYLGKSDDKSIVTYCDYEYIDEHSNFIRTSKIHQKYLDNIYLTILSTSIGGCTLLIPKLCFDAVGLFNENRKFTQDIEMWLRIAKAGYNFHYIQDILIKSRLHSEQGSISLSYLHRDETDDLFLWAIDFLGDYVNSISDQFIKILIRKSCLLSFNKMITLYSKSTVRQFYYKSYFVVVDYIVSHLILKQLVLRLKNK